MPIVDHPTPATGGIAGGMIGALLLAPRCGAEAQCAGVVGSTQPDALAGECRGRRMRVAGLFLGCQRVQRWAPRVS